MLSAVDLPEPDAPVIATNSPGVDVEVDAVERAHGRVLFAVDLGHAAQREERLGGRDRRPLVSGRRHRPSFLPA